MSEYKRLTKQDNFDDFCENVSCPHKYIEELGCSVLDCDNCYYNKIYTRLAELEDKIESGRLVELPCNVGDTATAIIDTLAYDNSLEKVKIEGLAYIVKDENGDITFQHISRIFPNEKEAEARLKELQEGKK